MTNQAKLISTLEALLAALKGSTSPKQPVTKLKASKSNVSAKTDRVLKRNARIARGFANRGIKLTFDKVSGRFDNVRPYSLWLRDGMQVQPGQQGVEGFFHISQTRPIAA